MWCAAQIKQPIPNVVYTPAGVSAFQGIGLWANAATAKPKPGDIVFFDFVEGGAPVEHVGIVVKDNLDGTVTTIEGNTSPEHKTAGSQANGGEVAQRIRAYKKDNKRKLTAFIVGFGTPKWSK
jgi:cell wall-associated NlpC family hydrolase